MQVLTADFETYYAAKYHLGTGKYGLTTFDYVAHPDFEVLGCSLKVDDEPSQWLDYREFAYAAQYIDWAGVAVLAHHAHFDGLILAEHYGVKRVGMWLDTLSMDRALRQGMARHDLGAIGMHWLGRPKLEMPDSIKGKHARDLTDAEWHALGHYARNDTDLTRDAFVAMMRVFPAGELRKIDLTIRMYTEPRIQIDESVLAPYAAEEKQRRAEFLARLGVDAETLGSSDKFATLLRSQGIEPQTKSTVSEKGWTYSFAKGDPFMQGLLDHEDPDIRDLAQARLDTKSTLNVTRPDRVLRLGHAGRLVPIYLVYAAAHTLRWGGGDKVNWQNNERTDSKNPRKGMIRKSMMAQPGRSLVVGDSAQIEARKVAWLAEEQYLINAFATGRDMYSEEASTIWRRPVNRKFVAPDGTKPDELVGQIAKCMVLGLGYGMGWVKFAIELLKGMLGTKPVLFTAADVETLGVDFAYFAANPRNIKRVEEIPTRRQFREMLIHCAVCWHLVNYYRDRYPSIPKLWEYAEGVIELMATGRRERVFRGTCETVQDGLLLPNGLVMQYNGLVHRGKAGWQYAGSEGYTKLYGGLFVENVDQALCRIIVADQMETYANEGHPIWGMTHDEVGSDSPEQDAATDAARLKQVMSVTPGWCPGLPLSSEVHFGKYYGSLK